VRCHTIRACPTTRDDRLGCEMSTCVESNRSCVNRIQLADSVGPMHSD
jgi:hypothetical protein